MFERLINCEAITFVILIQNYRLELKFRYLLDTAATQTQT